MFNGIELNQLYLFFILIGSVVLLFTEWIRIDLTAIRRRGFTIAAFSAEPLTPRYGHTLQSPVEAIAVNSHEGDVYTAFLDKADQIRIRPPLFVKQDGASNTCWSGYRLTVTLEGPVGVDPFGSFRRPSHRQDR